MSPPRSRSSGPGETMCCWRSIASPVALPSRRVSPQPRGRRRPHRGTRLSFHRPGAGRSGALAARHCDARLPRTRSRRRTRARASRHDVVPGRPARRRLAGPDEQVLLERHLSGAATTGFEPAFLVGETGFEPATARPPAGPGRLWRPGFGFLEPSRLRLLDPSCAQFGPQIGPQLRWSDAMVARSSPGALRWDPRAEPTRAKRKVRRPDARVEHSRTPVELILIARRPKS